MEKIFIPRLLKAPKQQERLTFAENISGLDTLTPVRGELAIAHRQTYLEITAQAETIVTLTCDRCLKHYNKRLQVDQTELVWLRTSPEADLPLEREVALEELEESLDPHGYFEPLTWLYEQFCLAIPLRKICHSSNCPVVTNPHSSSEPPVDRRWAKLVELKKQLSSS